MLSIVAPPDSPAMTSTTSPGTICSRAKFRTRIPSTVGIAWRRVRRTAGMKRPGGRATAGAESVATIGRSMSVRGLAGARAARRPARSGLCEVDVGDVAAQSRGGLREAVDPPVEDRHALQLDEGDRRDLADHDLLEALEQFGALLHVGLDRGRLQQSVDLGVVVAVRVG